MIFSFTTNDMTAWQYVVAETMAEALQQLPNDVKWFLWNITR